MKFPAMDRNRSYSVRVPQLSGGVNYDDALSMVEDNQLTDVRNMWWKNGALRTRPGYRYKNRQYVGLEGNAGQGKQSYIRHSLDSESTTRKINTESKIGNFIDSVTLINNDEAETTVETHKVYFVDENGTLTKYDSNISVSSLPSEDFNFNSSFIVSSGSGSDENAYLFTSSGGVFKADVNASSPVVPELYAPLVMVNGEGNPENDFSPAKGTMFEGYNMLTGAFRAWYTTDGITANYPLPCKGLTGNEGEDVTAVYTDKDGNEYTFIVPYNTTLSNWISIGDNIVAVYLNRESGFFSIIDAFQKLIPLEKSGINNNLKITAWKTDYKQKAKIHKMTFSTWFGGDRSAVSGGTRLFLAGNPDCPNLVHWSDINNPLYFPENNYAYIGSANQKITAFGKQSNILVIFKERETYMAQYAAGTTYSADDVINGKVVDVAASAAVFPITPIHSYIGCDCPNTVKLCNNRLVWANKSGDVYALTSANQYSERNIRKVSGNISRILKSQDMSNASAGDMLGRYALIAGDKMFLMDYNTTAFTAYSSHSNDETAQGKIPWHVWDFPDEIGTDIRIISDVSIPILFGEKREHVGDNDFDVYFNVHTIESDSDKFYGGSETPINCMLQTKLFDFNYSERLKNIHSVYVGIANIEGCTINLTYITERGDSKDQYIVTKESASEYSTNYISEKRFMPNWGRIQRFGIRLESVGTMAVDGISLKYSMYGGVR